MLIVDDLRALNREQRAAFTASLLGWTLDAFDFFILVFVVKSVADDFRVQVSAVSLGIALTLILRPVGAVVFGWLADRFGRRPVLMADVLLFAGFELASGFAPNLVTLLVLRALFGFAMGGEWGIGASLALESIPAKSRGIVSGVLQEGYALGYLLAALVNLFADRLGWRGMFMIGALPALLVLYIRVNVKESPAFEAVRASAKAARARRRATPQLPQAVAPGAAACQALSLLGGLVAIAAWPSATPPYGVFVLLLPAAVMAYLGKPKAGPEARTHLVYVLTTFWLAVAAAVVFGLVLFSTSKPLHGLGVPVDAVGRTGIVLLALWFLVRGGLGLRAALTGRALSPVDASSFSGSLLSAWPRLLYAAVLMTAFNLFSHGTQDLYPTFLKVQHHFAPALVSTLTVVANLGAIVGGILFGALSERIGRRRAIVLAALLALPVIPLWAYGATPLLLGLGAFLIQISVQGAWGVVPVHLNELSPDAARGTFPGFAYQLGNLIASGNAVIQAGFAESRHDDYAAALALTAGGVAVALAVLAWFGPEAKGVRFGAAPTTDA